MTRVDPNHGCQIGSVEGRGPTGVEGCSVKARSVAGMDRCARDGEDGHAAGGEADRAIGEAARSLDTADRQLTLTADYEVTQPGGDADSAQLDATKRGSSLHRFVRQGITR